MIVIYAVWRDGDIKSIEGYVTDHDKAKRVVDTLNKEFGDESDYRYESTSIYEINE